MRLLTIGDFHGKIPNLKFFVKKNKIDLILSVGDFSAPFLRPFIWKYWKELRKGKSIEDILGKKKYNNILKKEYESAGKVLRELNLLKIPVLIVYGNVDSTKKAWWYKKGEPKIEKYLKKLKNITFLEYSSRNFFGYNIFGFGCKFSGFWKKKTKGKKGYTTKIIKKLKIRKTEENELKNLFKKSDSRKTILLTHEPPFKIFDKILIKRSPRYGERIGDDILRKMILKHKPLLHVCGHMHEYQGEKKLGKTVVINPGFGYKGKFAIIDLPELKVRFMKI